MLRLKRTVLRSLPAAAAAVALGVPAALAAGMHPVLGAHLAGMGEHGVVNLHLTAKSGRL